MVFIVLLNGFYLVCHEPEPEDPAKQNWWTGMDYVGKGMIIMGAMSLLAIVGPWFF